MITLLFAPPVKHAESCAPDWQSGGLEYALQGGCYVKVKAITVYIILLIVLISATLSFRFIGQMKEKAYSEDLNAVYNQSIEFLNDYYGQNVESTYSQLEKREKLLAEYNHYTSKEKWAKTIEKDIEKQTLNKVLKPSSSSDISLILHTDKPHETYLVKFSLDVNYDGEKRKRTGELEYIKTDEGFKIHRFEIDVLWDPEHGRWVLY